MFYFAMQCASVTGDQTQRLYKKFPQIEQVFTQIQTNFVGFPLAPNRIRLYNQGHMF